MTSQLKVWEIFGVDLIVATSEREMKSLYMDYHGESIRAAGGYWRLMSPNEELEITDDRDNRVTMTAGQFARVSGYFRAMT